VTAGASVTDAAGATAAGATAGGGWLEIDANPCAPALPANPRPHAASVARIRVRMFIGCGL
jgi:hypothetical protein